MEEDFIHGFSRLSKEEKIGAIASIINDSKFSGDAASFSHPYQQELFDSFSENTLTNYYLPFGIAPNFLINGKIYHVPMVVEESSVVAAASSAAKFWSQHGGFRSKVLSSTKKGHVHFLWLGDKELLIQNFADIKSRLLSETNTITARMQERRGGVARVALEDLSGKIGGYFRIAVDFETADSMGANFINTVLETMAGALKTYVSETFSGQEDKLEVIMSILSNLVPECLVECYVACPVDELGNPDTGSSPSVFMHKFKTAVDIACIDPYRAATHNKGIMNGVDAVVIATGNDFRAVEAGAHAFASITGTYKSLSRVEVQDNQFKFILTMPLAVGTVGGLTALHPLAKRSMQILGNPSAGELMMLAAAVGLANNFSAVKALVTNGIQQGHMKMHLSNMLVPYHLNPDQKAQVTEYFLNRNINYDAVREYVNREFSSVSNTDKKSLLSGKKDEI